jgi:CRISPR/Cas system-associated endoribonuclease Cas2
MALYLISYDINEKDAFEYDNLYKKLNSIGATRILYSEWTVEDEVGKATTLYNSIAPLTQTKDRLLVQEVTKDAYWDKLLISDAVFNSQLKDARG